MSTPLPSELWRKILRHATYVPFLLDTEWNYDPDHRLWAGFSTIGGQEAFSVEEVTASDATKRAIALVCHTWWNMGVEFLYESIQISSVARVDRLVEIMKRSVSASYAGHGWWTKRIGWKSYLSGSKLETVLSLLQLCHNVQIFVVMRSTLQTPDQCRLAAILQSRFPHSLRRFESLILSPGDDHSTAVLETLPNVRLSSLFLTFRGSVLDHPLHPSLNTIETLSMYTSTELRSLPTQWNFPNLRNLALYYFNDDDIPALASFIDRHQDSIRCITMLSADAACNFTSLISSNVRSLTLNVTDLEWLGEFVERTSEVPDLRGITHLGVMLSDEWDYIPDFEIHTKNALARGCFSRLMVLRLLGIVRPEDISTWEDFGLLLRSSGIRLEYMDRKPIVKAP